MRVKSLDRKGLLGLLVTVAIAVTLTLGGTPPAFASSTSPTAAADVIQTSSSVSDPRVVITFACNHEHGYAAMDLTYDNRRSSGPTRYHYLYLNTRLAQEKVAGGEMVYTGGDGMQSGNPVRVVAVGDDGVRHVWNRKVPNCSLALESAAAATDSKTSSADCANATLYPDRSEVPAHQGTNINYNFTGCERVRFSSAPANSKWDSTIPHQQVGKRLLYWFHAGKYKFFLSLHWAGSRATCSKYWCKIKTVVVVVPAKSV